jgi:hypothetical protein
MCSITLFSHPSRQLTCLRIHGHAGPVNLPVGVAGRYRLPDAMRRADDLARHGERGANRPAGY